MKSAYRAPTARKDEDGKTLLGELQQGSPGNSGRRMFFKDLKGDLEKLEEARLQVATVNSRWAVIIGPQAEETSVEDQELSNAFQSIMRLRIDVG